MKEEIQMRNLKRALSMALAAVMLLGMMVIGASASYSDFTDQDEIVHKEAVALLTDLGVIGGKTPTSYDPTGTIERAALSKMIYFVMMGGTDATPYEGMDIFADVNGNWAEGYINYCASVGIFGGVGKDASGKDLFSPYGTLTVAQAAKGLLVALGYVAEDRGYNGATWTIGVISDAQTNGLLEGISQGVNEPITRDNAAQMIFNALNAQAVKPEYQYDMGTQYVSRYVNDGGTLGENKFNGLKAVTGVVTKNDAAALASNGSAVTTGFTGADAGKSTIGGTTYNVATTLDQLGKQVTIYTDKNNKLYSTVAITTDKNVVTSVSSTNGKTIAAYLAANYTADSLVVNTLANTAVSSSAALPSGATMEIIDNDGDGKIEYALISNYTLGKVVAKSTVNNGSINVSGLTAATAANTVGFDSVELNDYVLGTVIGGKLYVEKVEPFTGTVTAYNSTRDTITIDGVVYDYVTGASVPTGVTTMTDGALSVNSTNRYFLNKAGDIIAYIPGDGTAASTDYALVAGYSYTKASDNLVTGGPAHAEVYLILPDGSAGVYDVAANATGIVPDQTSSFSGASSSAFVLVTYSLNAANEVTLTPKSVGTNGTDTIASVSAAAFKGYPQLSSTAGSYTAIAGTFLNANTVFLFVNSKGVVTRYEGIANVPTMSATAGSIVIKNTSTGLASLVVFAAAPSADVTAGTRAYALSANGEVTSTGTQYPFAVNGEVVYLTLSSAPIAGKVYTYVTNDKTGISTLTEVTSTTGVITAYTSDLMIVGGAPLSYADNMVVYAVSGSDKAGYTVSLSALAANQKITYVLDGDSKVAAAYVLVQDATAKMITGCSDSRFVVNEANHTITAPTGVDGEDIVAAMTVSEGASIKYERGVGITVTAADGSTQLYTIVRI